ncbi:MAG: hypothetical protein BGN83_12955 [Rhizobium sp. 63-7]|nr:MAG: hypothetical protein BGN83_12955 [Rhizobium sp. 63-7]
MSRTKMSKAGAVVLPKAVRDAHGFSEGTEFEVIDGGREITLRPVEAKAEPPKRTLTVEEFLAMRIPYSGPNLTDEMIHKAIEEEAIRRWHEKNSR